MVVRSQKTSYKQGGKISFSNRHHCRLDPLNTQHELPKNAPFAPAHKKIFCYLRNWLVANSSYPKCKVYFRSRHAVYKEKRRHLRSKKFKMVIHPFSLFALVREFCVCILWLIAFTIDPLFGAFLSCYVEENKRFDTQNLIQLIINCLLLVDIIIQFFLGFTIDRTKEIVLDHRQIVREYLNGYFFYDVVPVIHGLVYGLTDLEIFKKLFDFSDSFHIWISIPQLYCFRFVRIYTLAVSLNNIFNFFKIRESINKCTTIALVVMIVIHWWTCALYLFPVLCYFLGYPFHNSWILRGTLGTKRSVTNLYIECLLCTVCHFFGAGKGNIRTTNSVERFILACMLMCGITCRIYIITIILQLFGTINVSETKYEELIYQLKEYMVTKRLPQALRKRLFMYYEYRFQKQFFMENRILDSLSEHLRLEVCLYGCRNLIKKVKIFQGASKEVIGAVVAMVKHEIYLPNDQIIKMDAPNDNVYFISFGTVSILLPNCKEMCHLEDGNHFGEVHVVLRDYVEEYIFSAVAIETTEVFYLDKRSFWYLVNEHPEIADSFEKTATIKLNLYRTTRAELEENVIDTSDIIMELRKGRILDRRRKR